MSVARKLVVAMALAAGLVTLHSASASAQVGPGNPSGGTRMIPVSEGTAPVLPTDFLSADMALRGWFGTLLASRYSLAFRPASVRMSWAMVPRKLWSR